ncbi:chaplin [Streptomyces sp. NPDC087850]|uniref:chaplin n=1 Tax=unclassified Streptomyces TaxID=2593676 RepID=UPI0037F72298
MRDLISKGLLTAAAASGVLSMSGGYAQAADASATAVGSPGVLSGNSVQVPLDIPANICGNTIDVIGLLNPAFGNVCANVSSGPEQHHGGGYEGGYGGSYESAYGHETPAGGNQGASSTAIAKGSPGVGSGNGAQVPIDIPVNVCGNSIDVVGLLNPVFGNGCENGTPAAPPELPERPVLPEPETPEEEPEESELPPTDGRVVTPSTPGTPTVPAKPPVTETVVQTPQAPQVESAVPAAPEAHAPTGSLASTGSDGSLLGAAAAASAGLLLGGVLVYRRSTASARV